MKNVKIISAIIAIIIVLGGGYFVYSDMQQQELLQRERDEQARAAQQALEQKQAEEAALAARTKCSEAGSYAVTTLDHEGGVGQDILVKQKSDSTDCKYDSTNAVFEIKNSDPEYYKAIGANALVTDLGTGPSGRSFRLYDLGDKKMITEKKYFEDLKIASTTLTYFGLAKQKADTKNCKDFKKITADGMTPNLVVEKTIDLKTFLVKEGKTTKCVASQ